MKGKFIVFEGADLCGKSTIAKMTTDWLNEQGINAIYTKHPGATNVGMELRKISKHSNAHIPPITEALINAAANNAFIEEVLIPALNRGTWVIGDRNNFISSLVYQVASGITITSLDKVHEATHPNPPKIDMLFILKTPKAELDNRRQKREIYKFDRYESNSEYMDAVNKGYEILAEEHKQRLMKFVKSIKFVNSEEATPMAFYIDSSKKKNEVFNLVTETLKGIVPAKQPL